MHFLGKVILNVMEFSVQGLYMRIRCLTGHLCPCERSLFVCIGLQLLALVRKGEGELRVDTINREKKLSLLTYNTNMNLEILKKLLEQ